MNDLIQDIERLESAVINLTEGASDEKRMAIYSLEDMIAQKKAIVEQFEKEFALDNQPVSYTHLTLPTKA